MESDFQGHVLNVIARNAWLHVGQMLYQVTQILVSETVFVAEEMFGSNGEGKDEVHGAIFLVGGLLVSGRDADPGETGKVADLGQECTPQTTTFPVNVGEM